MRKAPAANHLKKIKVDKPAHELPVANIYQFFCPSPPLSPLGLIVFEDHSLISGPTGVRDRVVFPDTESDFAC
jgi:hypothetical protein